MAHPTAKIISHVSSFRPEYRTDPMNSLGNWVNFQIILTHCSLAVSEIGFWSWWAPELFWCLYHVFRTMSLLIFYNFLSRQQRLGLKLNADKWVTQGINLDNFSACYMDVLQHIGYRSPLCTLQWVLLQAFHTHTDTYTHTGVCMLHRCIFLLPTFALLYFLTVSTLLQQRIIFVGVLHSSL